MDEHFVFLGRDVTSPVYLTSKIFLFLPPLPWFWPHAYSTSSLTQLVEADSSSSLGFCGSPDRPFARGGGVNR